MNPNTTLMHRAAAPFAAFGTILMLVATSGMSGQLISHFHLTRAVAVAIINLIATGGFWAIAMLYPFIVPVEITLQTLVRAFGTAYAIGW